MSLNEIEREFDNLESKTKKQLVKYIKELMLSKKRQESKLMSYKTRNKYYRRQLTNIKERIEKSLNISDDEKVWDTSDGNGRDREY